MPLLKTEKAVAELSTRQRTLGLKERALLLLADGRKSGDELLAMVQADANVLHHLLAHGYLARTAPVKSAPARQPAVSADPFHGNRSLATARLYAMDMTERLFARTHPDLAQSLRNQLRQAQDRADVDRAIHELLEQVTEQAGTDRTEGSRQRLQLLLPVPEQDTPPQ